IEADPFTGMLSVVSYSSKSGPCNCTSGSISPSGTYLFKPASSMWTSSADLENHFEIESRPVWDGDNEKAYVISDGGIQVSYHIYVPANGEASGYNFHFDRKYARQ